MVGASSPAKTPTLIGAYQPRRRSRCRCVAISGLSYHLREWGPESQAPLLLLHGARDSSASFQFLVDALGEDRHVMAVDWRGHGRTAWTPGHYFQTDFLRDLDVLVEGLQLEPAVPVLGHSMGGNIAALYAALRPARVSHLIILDALGSALSLSPSSMPDELLAYLDAARQGAKVRAYPTVSEMAGRLLRQNPRLDTSRAAFIADTNAVRSEDGQWRWPHDPTFRKSLPSLHSVEEWAACWRRIEAPVLGLLSSDLRPGFATADDDAARARASYFPRITLSRIPDTGHNLHHDAPKAVAGALDAFLCGGVMPLPQI